MNEEKILYENFENSFVYIKMQNEKYYEGITKKINEEEKLFCLNDLYFKVFTDIETYIIKIYFLKDNFLEERYGHYKYELGEEIEWKLSLQKTKEYRKQIEKNRLHEKQLIRAIKYMEKVFSSSFYIRVKNKSGKYCSYFSILDAYFVGTNYSVKLSFNRTFRLDYWIIDYKYFFRLLKNNPDFKKQLLITQNMLEETKDFYILKKSKLFKFVKKLKRRKMLN